MLIFFLILFAIIGVIFLGLIIYAFVTVDPNDPKFKHTYNQENKQKSNNDTNEMEDLIIFDMINKK